MHAGTHLVSLMMECNPFTAGSIFALFVLPGLIIAAAIVLAAMLKEKGE